MVINDFSNAGLVVVFSVVPFMASIDSSNYGEKLTLRQAAVIAGFAYLTGPIIFAQLAALPTFVVPGNLEQTAQNITLNPKLFIASMICYLITFTADVVIAWALYVLFVPANKYLSLLTACFRWLYAAIAFFSLLNLVMAFRLLNAPDYVTVFGTRQLYAQMKLLLDSFRYDWSMGLILLGIHLVLLGFLIYGSGYVPRWIGILLLINGLGIMTNSLQPYLYPNARLEFLIITFFGEVVFMLWLLIKGWKIEELKSQS